MQKNDIVHVGGHYYRVLSVKENAFLAIDCIKETMPVWLGNTDDFSTLSSKDLIAVTGKKLRPIGKLPSDSKRIMYHRYGLISPLVSSIDNKKLYTKLLADISLREHISKQTLRNFLCTYLVYQDLSVLAPAEKKEKIKELSAVEKDFRWALNRWYYNQNRNTLEWTFNQLLREKYCDAEGKLLEERPTYNQFYYFFQKTKSTQNLLIARNGMGDYKRNDRPLLGDNLQAKFPNIGVGMIDGTVCDIYLVDTSGNVVGRPIMTACIDANCALCCGYYLSWEGGTYSLRNLILNTIADKVEYCKKHNIIIRKEDWDCSALPGTLISDKGSEYIGETFSQLTDLGVILVDLEAFRPDLKPMVEKFFDIIQGYFKGELRGKGVVEKDFGERTNRTDYRKQACLTLEQFEEIIIRAVIYYNSQRTLEYYPYSEEMLNAEIQPTSAGVWNYKKNELGTNLIPVSEKEIVMTLLPRTNGRFERNGLIVNKLRYVHQSGNYTEKYLSGADATIAYSPDNVSRVWLFESNEYTEFRLIESRLKNKDLQTVEEIKERTRLLIKGNEETKTQGQIDLSNHIRNIANQTERREKETKGIRANRQKEIIKNHKEIGGEI